MKTLIIAGLIILLSGCASIDMARTKAAAGFDAVLEGAEMVTCSDASVGSVLRRYGKTAVHFTRWRDFCFGDGLPYIEAP